MSLRSSPRVTHRFNLDIATVPGGAASAAPRNCFSHFYYVSSALGVTSKPLVHSIMIARLGQGQRSDFISKISSAPGYQALHQL